jgi:hypothetical protein
VVGWDRSEGGVGRGGVVGAVNAWQLIALSPLPPRRPPAPADNHVWAAGSITAAVRTARSAAGFSTKIEVEARDLAEALEAVRAA